MYNITMKAIVKIKKMILISNTNRENQCDISRKANINSDSIFEGRNCVYSRTSLISTEVGFSTYISSDCSFNKSKIGRYCSIASNVKLVAGDHPTREYVSTHPLFYTNKSFAGINFINEQTFEEYSYADKNKKYLCIIGNDVWIGEDVKIINGVSIGDGAIIATGSVVNKNIPPYAIVGGVPAKLIRYRFNEEEINYLLNLKWWNKDEAWLRNHARLFSNIDSLKGFGENNEFIKEDNI